MSEFWARCLYSFISYSLIFMSSRPAVIDCGQLSVRGRLKLHRARKCLLISDCVFYFFSKATQVNASELEDLFQETSTNIFQINANGKMIVYR